MYSFGFNIYVLARMFKCNHYICIFGLNGPEESNAIDRRALQREPILYFLEQNMWSATSRTLSNLYLRSARTSCTNSEGPVRPQEKSGSLIHRYICHQKTHQTNPMARWDPIDAPLVNAAFSNKDLFRLHNLVPRVRPLTEARNSHHERVSQLNISFWRKSELLATELVRMIS